MSLATQFQNLQKKTSSFLQQMVGSKGVMEGAADDDNFGCYFSPVAEAEMLNVFGIRNDFNLLLRVPKTEPNFVPEIGRNVKLYAVNQDGSLGALIGTARLVKPRVHPAGVDHVFECKSQW